MSRIYFHTQHEGTAELAGAERAWLSHLARGPAEAAWDLDGSYGFDRAGEILALVPEVPDGPHGANYLHTYLREAQTQDARNKVIYKNWKPGTLGIPGETSYEPQRRLVSSLRTSMRVNGLEMIVAGVRLNTSNIDLNTALVAGSDPIALAAKIHGWCESHAWIEGPDRAWFADIIELGLNTGLFRRDMGWDQPREYDSGPGVVPLLRASGDAPVVMSYSITEGFPDETVGEWMPSWPESIPRDWSELTEDQQQERTMRQEQWYELTDERRWEISMAGLRSDYPWAQLSADTLRGVMFHLPVTAYDLISPDCNERIRSILGDHPDYREDALVRS